MEMVTKKFRMKAFIGLLIAILCVPFLLSTFYKNKQTVNYVSAADGPTPTCNPKACDPEYACLLDRRCNGVNKKDCARCYPEAGSTKNRDYCTGCTPITPPVCKLPVIEDYFSISFNKISPDVDILFAFDTTGSMGGLISTAKSVGNKLLDALDEQLGNKVQFGIIDFRDYPISPYGASMDYPYKLVVPLTKDKAKAMSGINGLSIGNGADGPESYLRVMYETYTDSNIQWRENTKKVLVFLGDSYWHDPEVDGSVTMEEAIKEFVKRDISLLYIDVSCWSYKRWDKVTEVIGNGSTAACVRSSGEEFVSNILDLIIGVVRKVKRVYLNVWNPMYEPWVVYEEMDGLKIPPAGMEFRFPYKIVATGTTTSGIHKFTVKLWGDKLKYTEKEHIVEIKCDGSYAVPTATPTMLPTFTPTPIRPTGTPAPPMCDACGILNKISDIKTHGGDYNCDNVLNVADYSIWRKDFVDKTESVPGYIMSDGNCNGVSDSEDYSNWRNNFIK